MFLGSYVRSSILHMYPFHHDNLGDGGGLGTSQGRFVFGFCLRACAEGTYDQRDLPESSKHPPERSGGLEESHDGDGLLYQERI